MITPFTALMRGNSSYRRVSPGRTNGEKGFSLAEAMIILAVIGIVAGFTIPTLNSTMRGWRVAADAREMATTLSVARMGAAANFTRYQLAFTIAHDTWSLERFNKVTSAYDIQGSTITLSRGVNFKTSSASGPAGFPTQSSTAIIFNSRGIPVDTSTPPQPTGNNVVYFSSSAEDYAVTVTMSGKVQIWRLRNGSWETV